MHDAQVKEKLQVGDSQISPRKNKTDIFSPRSPIYRPPLSSRRNNNNVPSGSGNGAGFILPQAQYIGSLQQQHLQHNNASLYSPRSRTHYQSALQAQQAASLLSPRQRAHRTSSKDHPSSNAHSKQKQPAAHAASAAGRPAIPVLRLQLQQPQAQLFSPRQYHKPAPLGGLSPRAAPHLHGAAASHHAQAQHGGALTWRGPTTSTNLSQGHRQHQQQQQQQQPPAQSAQTSPATASASRSD